MAILSFIIDSLTLCFSGWLAYSIRTSSLFLVDSYITNPWEYFLLLITAIFLWHSLYALRGGYHRNPLLFRIDELLLQFDTSIILFFLLTSATFLYHNYNYSRLIVFFGWLLFVFFGSLGRQISYRIREALHRRGFCRKKVVLSGSGGKKKLFEERLVENSALGIDIFPLPANASLIEAVSRENIDEVFIFEDHMAYENVWQLRDKSRNPHLTVHLVPSFGNLYLRNFAGGFFDGAVMINLDSPTARKFILFAKRTIDLIVALLFLGICSPIMLIAALLVKLDSRGPVFFSQQRIGRDGKAFTIYKFRSMLDTAAPYALTPIERIDPRITRIGAFLRSTGLDELPQLWNVFKGEMSLVGPRPEMPFIVEKYSELEMKRLKVKPGITGLWQVYARATRLPIHSHIEYDLYYIENLSLSLDLMILLDTIPTMILRTGI